MKETTIQGEKVTVLTGCEATAARAEEVAARLVAGTLKHEQVDQGESFGRALAVALRKAGYVDLESTSTCKRASYEALLGNGTTEVEITSAVFMGAFTEVTAWPQTHQPPKARKGRKRA